MNMIKSFMEKKAFGVCTWLGDKLGIKASRIRFFFVYTSFLTLGSPVIIYLMMAFFLNLKNYLGEKRGSIWDL